MSRMASWKPPTATSMRVRTCCSVRSIEPGVPADLLHRSRPPSSWRARMAAFSSFGEINHGGGPPGPLPEEALTGHGAEPDRWPRPAHTLRLAASQSHASVCRHTAQSSKRGCQQARPRRAAVMGDGDMKLLHHAAAATAAPSAPTMQVADGALVEPEGQQRRGLIAGQAVVHAGTRAAGRRAAFRSAAGAASPWSCGRSRRSRWC